jgi:hypothetical protein
VRPAEAKPPARQRRVAVTPGPGEPRPEQQAGERKARSRRSYRLAGVSVLVIAVLAAGSVALFGRTTNGRGGQGASAAALRAEMTTRNLAASWVFQQVSRTATVSCDPAMCVALEAHGIPKANLLELRPGTANPLGSDLIVATAPVRSQFGSVLNSVYAPAVLASFGSGGERITIRLIAPHGAARYMSALAADVVARKASGAYLLSSTRITASAGASKQLAGGQADLRLLYAIAYMAAQQPLDIVAFGGSAPGASAGIPLRSVDLTKADGTASPADLQAMLDGLRAQHALSAGMQAEIVRLAGDRTVLRIEFAAPSPLGLGGTP